MSIPSAPITDSFGDVLNCLVAGNNYRTKPPVGPPADLPALTNEELAALQTPSSAKDDKQYSYDSLALVEDNAAPVFVEYPSESLLGDLNVCGIDGSNQRVARASFYFILARASIVDFKYSSKNEKPYFYDRCQDASAVTWVDGNIFDEKIRLFTAGVSDSAQNLDVLKHVQQQDRRPLLVRYDSATNEKSPAQHALGWAVKLQQALEMACLQSIRTEQRTVCIKDGPLYSTSLGIRENVDGLSVIHTWKRQNLIACSKRVQDSRLLLELLLSNRDLRDYWFPGQNLIDNAISDISSDALILPRLLRPGHRTPFIKAIPRARVAIPETDARLAPLACYYFSRHKPHTYVRFEVPACQWESNRSSVLEAISVAAWQHELGRIAPLVQLVADERCQLAAEKRILEYQTSSAVEQKQLDLPEAYQ